MMTLEDLNLEDRAELEVALPRLLIIAGEVAARAGDLLIFGPFDLNVAKYSLLIALSHMGEPVSMTEIGQHVLRSPSNLTQLVDHLEQRGLVRRSASTHDRRVNLLDITDVGRQLLRQVDEHYHASMRESLKDHRTEELRQFVAGLQETIVGSLQALQSHKKHL